MFKKKYEVVIIGAGHSGLCLSYFLSQKKIEHIVIEKNKIGHSWQNQRWDNFKMTTPNLYNVLPDFDDYFLEPNEYCTANEFIKYLELYAQKYNLPICENTEVLEVTKNSVDNEFEVKLNYNTNLEILYSKAVVICSGFQNKKYIPNLVTEIASNINQLHSSEYKNFTQIKKGSVLIIGSAQSGIQIAEDLTNNNINVILSTSKVGRLPRRYRGKDIVEWLKIIGFYDVRIDNLFDKSIVKNRQSQITSSEQGKTLSLQSLSKMNVKIIGSIIKISDNLVEVEQNVTDNIKYADEVSIQTKKLVDEFIEKNKIAFDQDNFDINDSPDFDFKSATKVVMLNLEAENIQTIIFATGFSYDFTYLKLPFLNDDNLINHNKGVSKIEGLYFLGMPWQIKRMSGIIMGARADAEFICEKIINNL